MCKGRKFAVPPLFIPNWFDNVNHSVVSYFLFRYPVPKLPSTSLLEIALQPTSDSLCQGGFVYSSSSLPFIYKTIVILTFYTVFVKIIYLTLSQVHRLNTQFHQRHFFLILHGFHGHKERQWRKVRSFLHQRYRAPCLQSSLLRISL